MIIDLCSGRLSVENLSRAALVRNVGMEDDDQDAIETESLASQEQSVVEIELESDEELQVPTKRQRKGTGSGSQARSKPARKQKATSKGADSNTDLFSILEAGVWPAAERPPGVFQNREWINSKSYESLSMMKKASTLFSKE